jgi:hypothetical protein
VCQKPSGDNTATHETRQHDEKSKQHPEPEQKPAARSCCVLDLRQYTKQGDQQSNNCQAQSHEHEAQLEVEGKGGASCLLRCLPDLRQSAQVHALLVLPGKEGASGTLPGQESFPFGLFLKLSGNVFRLRAGGHRITIDLSMRDLS